MEKEKVDRWELAGRILAIVLAVSLLATMMYCGWIAVFV